MRKIFIIFILTFVMFSCSKDENNVVNPPQQLDTNSVLFEMTGIFDSVVWSHCKYISQWNNISQLDSITISFETRTNGSGFSYYILCDTLPNCFITLEKRVSISDSVNYVPYVHTFASLLNLTNSKVYLQTVTSWGSYWAVIKNLKVTIKRHHK